MSDFEAQNIGYGSLDDSELKKFFFTYVPPSEDLPKGRPNVEKKKKNFFFLTRDPP